MKKNCSKPKTFPVEEKPEHVAIDYPFLISFGFPPISFRVGNNVPCILRHNFSFREEPSCPNSKSHISRLEFLAIKEKLNNFEIIFLINVTEVFQFQIFSKKLKLVNTLYLKISNVE